MKKFDSRVFMASIAREVGAPQTKPGVAGLRQLWRLRGEDFVRQSYRAILKREADPAGLAGYGPLARHAPGRAWILAALALSPENPRLPPWLAAFRPAIGRALGSFKKGWNQ